MAASSSISVHPQIVITGGPGGGKTTFLGWLQTSAPQPQRFVPVPEAATRLLQAGMRPGCAVFQEEILALQLATEVVCQSEAEPGQVLVCDRGALDGLAYWRLLGLEVSAFLKMSGMPLAEHLARYTAVIHLRTAAAGAVDFYQRDMAGRHELPEEARRIDDTLCEIWSAHPSFHIIENGPGGWPEKLLNTWNCFSCILEQIRPQESPSP